MRVTVTGATTLALGLSLAACAAPSGLDDVLAERVSGVAQVPAPEGFVPTTSLSNGSVVREFGGIPVDFTGALMSKNRARIIFTRPVTNDSSAVCPAVGRYLGDVADFLGIQWEPKFPQGECPSLLGGSLDQGSEVVVPVWEASGPRGEFEPEASVLVGPGRSVLVAIDIARPH